MDAFSTVLLGISNDVQVPERLKEFLEIDDQGIEGFEFMLKHPNLSERIPADIRADYVATYSRIRALIDEQVSVLRKSLDEIQENPTPIIHDIISRS